MMELSAPTHTDKHHRTGTPHPFLPLLPEMSLSCLRATDPNITNVHKLYDDASHSGHLWISNDAVPDCSSTYPPSPSNCVVCQQRGLYAVCSDLPQTAKLVMEAPGQHIDIIKSECPGLLGDDLSDTWKWWQIFIPIFIIAALVVCYILKKYCNTSTCFTRVNEQEAIEREEEEEEEAFHTVEEEAVHLRRLEMERDAEADT